MNYRELVERHGSIREAARQSGIPYTTLQENHSRRPSKKIPDRALSQLGYNLADFEISKEEAWSSHVRAFEVKVGASLASQWQTIKRPSGPFVIFHCTDPHVDDDGSALNLLSEDIRASHDLDAIMCHGGDLLNNWPMAGRLAQQWAHQTCTMPSALKRAEHYIDIFKPDVWVDGNHEEMNPYLDSWIKDKLPKNVITDYWVCNFQVKAGRSDPFKAVLSHKLGKGSSWFHKLHGHLREMMEGQEADLYMDGHLHCDGVIDHSMPERGMNAVGVASGGYKLADKYARRISKSSGEIKIRGRAHWMVCDPDAEFDESRVTAFKSARHASAMLSGLQNLSEV